MDMGVESLAPAEDNRDQVSGCEMSCGLNLYIWDIEIVPAAFRSPGSIHQYSSRLALWEVGRNYTKSLLQNGISLRQMKGNFHCR